MGDDGYLTSREVAAILRKSEWWVKMLRAKGGGPAYYKFGRNVVYRKGDLEEWLALARVSA